MGERLFDELARALAQPLPRRRLLRLLGGAIAVAAVPALRPAWSSAAREPAIVDPPSGPWGEPIPCNELGNGQRQICDPTFNCVKCCNGSDGAPVSCCPCYVSCAPSGLCGEQVACPPDGRPFCGSDRTCCASNETCFKGSLCVPICDAGETLCDGSCCPRGSECVQQKLPGRSRPALLCLPRCPNRGVRCGLGCCPARQKCINPAQGRCSPCDAGRQPCGRKCCPTGSSCCDPRTGLCCRKSSETCAGFAGQATCCPRGTRACKTDPQTGKPRCCAKGEACAQLANEAGTVPVGTPTRYGCCPPERTVEFSGGGAVTCCPPGYRSLGGRFVLPAGGGGGLCCREDKLCGDTCCGTNGDPGIDQTCCNGACVSLFFDPQNCGGCGRACAAGQRCSGGACVPA